ncbi:MAG: hypothetical protein ACP5HQ_01310 [Thermoprotei archaeon]
MKTPFSKQKDRVILHTRLYHAVFKGNKVRGHIEDAGLKVDFIGKVDKAPESPEEAHNAIVSLFSEPPTEVKLGAVVLAKNSRAKIRAWGIKINDVKALFNKLSTLKFIPVDVKDLSDVYGMRIGEVKRALKEPKVGTLTEQATKERAKRYKAKSRVAKVGEVTAKLVLKGRAPKVELYLGTVKLYEGQVSVNAVDQYFKMSNKELVEEAISHLEALINLLGKAGDQMVIPGIVEGKVRDGKVFIRTATERAVLPWGGYQSLVSFVNQLRQMVS